MIRKLERIVDLPFLTTVEATTTLMAATLTAAERITTITIGLTSTVSIIVAIRFIERIGTTTSSVPAAASRLIQFSAGTLGPTTTSTSVPRHLGRINNRKGDYVQSAEKQCQQIKKEESGSMMNELEERMEIEERKSTCRSK